MEKLESLSCVLIHRAIHKDFIFATFAQSTCSLYEFRHPHSFGTMSREFVVDQRTNPPISKGDAIMMYLGMLPLPRRKFHQ